MVSDTSIRTSLQTSLFSRFGKSVTLNSKGSPTLNERGEVTDYNYTTSTITIVDYGIISQRKSRESWGIVEAGDRTAAIPYDVTINVDDTLTIRSNDYTVVEVKQPELPDRVVTLAQLRLITS